MQFEGLSWTPFLQSAAQIYPHFLVRTASTVSSSWVVRSNSERPRWEPGSRFERPSFTKARFRSWTSRGHRPRPAPPPTCSLPRPHGGNDQRRGTMAGNFPLTIAEQKVVIVNSWDSFCVTVLYLMFIDTIKWKFWIQWHISGRVTPDFTPIGLCKALYSFTAEHSDELTFKEGRHSTGLYVIQM